MSLEEEILNRLEATGEINTKLEKSNDELLVGRLLAGAFDINKPIPKPEPIISIDGNTISTAQNITVFKGASKAGKTANTAAIIAGMMATPGDIVDTLEYQVKKNIEGKLVIHIDTEQGESNFWELNRNILRRAGRSEAPKWYKSYNIRKEDLKDRIKGLELLLDHHAKEFNGVFAIFIDGIADYVTSPNDEEDANRKVSLFEKLAMIYDCPVITVIHLNPSSLNGITKGRGHLDSQLERKAESVLMITKDKETEVSTVEGLLFRNAGNVPKMQFKYDTEKSYHVSCGFKIAVSKEDRKRTEAEELANRIFDFGRCKFTASELVTELMESEAIKERAAKSKIALMREYNLIENEGDSRSKLVLVQGANLVQIKCNAPIRT